MSVGPFRVKDVKMTYAEVDITGGLADGTFVEVDFDSDLVTLAKGADGENCFVDNADEAGKITFTLKAFSQANVLLQAIFARHRLTRSPGEAVTVRDLNGGATPFMAEGKGRLTKPGPMSFGKDISDVKWVVIVGQLKVSGGGVA